MLSLWLCVLIASITGVQSMEWIKMNSAPVCYGAKNSSYGEFTAQQSFYALKIKLVRLSGHHDCDEVSGGYFGCEPYLWSYFMQGANDEPQNTSAKQSNETKRYPGLLGRLMETYGDFIAPAAGQRDHRRHRERRQIINPFNPSPNGPGPEYMHLVYPFLTDGLDNTVAPVLLDNTVTSYLLADVLRPSWDMEVILPSGSNPIIIPNGQVLRLWHGEDLRDIDEAENQGTICADVYAEVDTAANTDPTCRCLTRECLAVEVSDTTCHCNESGQ